MGIREMEARARADLEGKRGHEDAQKWLGWRSPVWLRALVLVIAAAGIVASAQWTVDAYQESAAYRQAGDCTAKSGAATGSCVGLEEARVVDKWESQGCTGSGSNRSCTTKYSLRLDEGRRIERLDVSGDTYDAAYRGSRADLQTWQGAVVGITVRGHTQTFPAPSENSMRLGTAAVWLLLGLTLWAGLSGLLGTLLQPVSIGWALLVLPLVFFFDYALFGASAGKWLLVAVLTAGIIGGTVVAQRHGASKRRLGGTFAA
ncbi:hypothetical protein [Streptomyces sp. HGB0020]|uniref:hypothetical protein n=1 Tax=Streptomyces sp. HGB0020 TaxID=1078086 RepID=UPI00034EA930|nr:hypothetical protein [Streptomyces sp. HGB0020]EPD55779.1 hypothetical protein HMPREF1211_07744 [Streptomyces sp. HGB0020]